jgi:hypothetical protein
VYEDVIKQFLEPHTARGIGFPKIRIPKRIVLGETRLKTVGIGIVDRSLGATPIASVDPEGFAEKLTKLC